MKYTLLAALLVIHFFANAQNTSPAEMVSEKIATRLKDSLSLSEEQKARVFKVNMELHQRKMTARRDNEKIEDLRRSLQRIENKRDSLYHIILNPGQRMHYQQKKEKLIRGD